MNTSHTAFSGDFSSSKKALRQQIECWRRGLSPLQIATQGHLVFQQLQNLPFWHASNCVALYASQPFEVPTFGLMEALFNAHKQVCLPGADFEKPALAFVRSLGDLEAGRHGICCPKACCPPAALADIGLIVVPALAFANNGARLGRGGGFYDRLLAHPDMKALRVGLCFDECLMQSLPEEAHDERVHWVVTDRQCIQGLPRK